MDNFGVKVTVYTAAEEVGGWLIFTGTPGLYLSLDREGRKIRFIHSGDVQSITYHINKPKARFLKRPGIINADKFSSKAEDQIIEVLDRLDYNRISRLARRFRELRFRRERYNQRLRAEEEVYTDDIFEARLANAELLEELESSQFLELLQEHSSQIRRFVSKDTLPAIEAEIVTEKELDEMISLARGEEVEEDFADSVNLSKVHPGEAIQIVAILASPDWPSKRKKKKENSRWPRRLRLASAAGKLVLGGAFATANLALGSLAGVVSALPTLTLGTVGAAVGVVTSAYTGWNTSLDAMKDFAAALERE